jgi:HAE1 family hydrophobic/amphiphilic exporter-1
MISNFLGRTYRVTAQADGDFRQDLHAIGNLKTRNAKGEMLPLSSVASFPQHYRPYRVEHFNLFPSAAVQGGTQPGYSTGYGLAAMEQIARATCPTATRSHGPSSPFRRSLLATRPSTCS